MSQKSSTDSDIKSYLNERGVTISPSARAKLIELSDPQPALDLLVKEYKSRVIVSESDVKDVIRRVDTRTDTPSPDLDTTTSDKQSTDNDSALSETMDEDPSSDPEHDDTAATEEELGYRPTIREHDVIRVTEETADTVEEFDETNPNLDDPFDAIKRFSDEEWPDRDTEQREIKIESDISGHSNSSGDIEDFAAYFRSRYEKLAGILRDRVTPRAIDTLGEKSHHRGEDTTLEVIGMVNEKYTSQSDNPIIVLEDTTGETIRVVFSDEEDKEVCAQVVPDEVIAVEGQLSDDGSIIFGDRLHFPEIPPRRSKRTADRPVKAALVSDIHFGAREFAVDKWNQFVEWIGNQPDIEYLLVAGDIIEGVGIYAGQQEELAVPNLERQYELCALAFDQLPDDLDIIVIPGNHDGIRLAEPQPTFPEEVRELFGDNVHWGGNPSTITLESVKFLLYHGVSLNSIIDNLPQGDIQHPLTAMKPLLKKRHVAPLYGEGVRIAPEHEDRLVMETIPDVFHTGHVHTFDIGSYRNVTAVNSGTWQHQTKYQIDLDVDPDVGYCTVVDLFDLSTDVYSF